MKHPKKEAKLFCNFPTEELQKRYFRGYHYNFWVTKAKALLYFINHPDKIEEVQSDNKEDNVDYVLDNFKMEIHMMVFHSAESLFLNIMAAIFNPNYPWVFLAKCTPERLNGFIKQVSEQGLEGVLESPSPSEFMRNLMYPGVDGKHAKFELAKKTSDQVVNYIKSLAKEYTDHFEYNSYKHGLRCFPGKTTSTMKDEKTDKVVFHSEQHSIEYLEFKNEMIEGSMQQRVRITDKTYDYMRDYGIIDTTTAILLNIFNKRRVDLDATPENPKNYRMFFLADENFKLTDLFKFRTEGSIGGYLTKFSI
jgi:hypothetical protein